MEATLLTLLQEDGVQAVWRSHSRGDQYNGPCPWCGGKDRFRIQPHQGTYGWFACSQCGRSGSAIDYLMLKRGWSKGKALMWAGWKPKEEKEYSPLVPQSAREECPNWGEPPGCWQATAQAFTDYCREVLWSEQGAEALAYLQQRGLTEQTIREAQLGYYPRQTIGSAKAWGRPVKLSAGIVIPWHYQGKVWRLTIRHERVQEGQGRYIQVAGGSNGLYRADDLRQGRPTVVVTEGEFDALAVVQACRGSIAVVATGTTQGSHTPRWLALLAQQERVLLAFDADESGDHAARWWGKRLKNAQRLRPLWEDPNQMLQDGVDLRQWVEDHAPQTLPATAEEGTSPDEEGELQAFLAEYQEQELCSICFAPALVELGPDDMLYCTGHHPYRQRAREVGATSDPQVIRAADMLAFLHDYAMLLAPGSRVALDCETTGKVFHTEKIVTVQLGTPGKVSILDVRGFYNLPEVKRQAWRTAFQRLFATPDVTWLGHNLKFDWLFLRQHFGVRPGQTYDTMIAEQALHEGHEGIKFGMKDLAERYGLTVSKEEQLSTVGMDRTPAWKEPFRPELITYMAQDVEIPHQIYAAQQPLLDEADLQRVVELENAALLAVVMMEHKGALISRERLSQLTTIKQQRQAELEQQLYPVLEPAYQQSVAQGQAEQQAAWKAYEQAEQEALTSWDTYATWQAQHSVPARPKPPVPFKLSSSEQLLLALRGLGIDLRDTKAETLEEVVGRHACIPQLLQWRKCQTLVNTFCSKLPQHCAQDSRIHADFHTVASGRYVTSKPNLQAVPKQRKGETEEEDPRRCVVAAPGYKLLAADLSNIELRILAEVSADQTMLRLFAEGKDLHAETAKLMFHLPAETDTKAYLVQGKAVRDIAKTINFGLAYGMGASGLAGRTGVDLETAKELMRKYFSTYRGVDAYLKRSGRDALKRGYAVSLSGRRRYYPLSETEQGNRSLYGRYERSAKNHPIQGSNADILKRALALLSAHLPAVTHIVLTVHDEIVLECPDAQVEEASRLLQACMMEACRDFLKVVTIPTPTVLVGTHWQKD